MALNNFLPFLNHPAYTKNKPKSPMQKVLDQTHKPITVGPMQKINLQEGGRIDNQLVPTIPTYQGNQARLDAQKKLGLSPQFVSNLMNAAPYVGKPLATSTLNNAQGAGAEYLGKQRPNQIVLSPKMQDPATVLHEGLHRTYDNNPQVRKQFVQAYNQSASPALKNYLMSRLQPYRGASKGLDEGGVPIPNYNPNDLNTLPENLQNEAHSFVSEFPTLGLKLPDKLNKYYKQYYNTTNNPMINKTRRRKPGADIKAGA